MTKKSVLQKKAIKLRNKATVTTRIWLRFDAARLTVDDDSRPNDNRIASNGSGGFRGGKGPCPPQRIMVSASDVAVDKHLYVSRQSESVVKSAYVSVTTINSACITPESTKTGHFIMQYLKKKNFWGGGTATRLPGEEGSGDLPC